MFKTIEYLNIGTLSLIISLLLISRGLEFSGFFSRTSGWILKISTGSTTRLYLLVVLFTALSSSIIMNDTSLFIFIPFIITLSRYIGNLDYLLVLATISANIGSSLTPIGNPQNIIIWQHYKLGFFEFVYTMTPFFLVATAILITYLLIGVRKLGVSKQYRRTIVPRVRLDRKLFIASIALLILNILLAQLGLQVYGLILTIIVYLILNRTLVIGLDYALILIFALMFIDFNELSYIVNSFGILPQLENTLQIILLSTFLSQIMSNVPTTITLVGHIARTYWKPLAIGVNLGGVGFLTGSMANIITLRLGDISLKTFHKYSLPYFIALLTSISFLAYHNIYP